jgi:hypothetical protein
MKWGRRRQTITKPKRGRLHIDRNKIIDGKKLSDEIISSIGGVVVSRLVGGFLVSRGSELAGTFISTYGSIYSIGTGVGNVINRIDRKPTK